MTTPLTEPNERRPTGTRNRVISTPSNRSAAAYHSDQSPSRPSSRKTEQTHNPNRHTSHAQHPGQKKKQQGGKKGEQHDQIPPRSLDGQEPQPSHGSPNFKATPLKQAYAGPTFHSSPAASSLPLPSFFTKSLSTVAASPPPNPNQLDGEASAESDGETARPINAEAQQAQREPSPLDFMFEAARRARDTPKSQSPAHPFSRPSPFDETPRAGSHTPGDASSDSGFPFELDGNGGAMPIGPAFATPYRDRMAALKPSQSEPNCPPQFLDEKERREKSEALKKLLGNATPRQFQDSNEAPFCDHGGNPYSTTPPQHQVAGSNLPQPIFSGQRSHIANQIYPTNPPMSEPPFRSSSSRLSREYLPDNHYVPAELDSDPGTPSRVGPRGKKPDVFKQPNGFAQSPQAKPVVKRAKSSYSSQEIEDDLRRVLKLEMTPGR